MARIALTGAAGRIATSLRPRLRAAGHDLGLLDVVPVPDAVPGERIVEADLRDVEAHADAFAGAELVVHLGGLSDEQPWADLLAVNVDGTRAVLDAVVSAGVGRVLLASSVHAAGYVPVDDPATAAGMPLPAPDTYYGASKAAVEALGGLYAGRFGLTVVTARIMTFGEAPSGRSSLRWWLSGDDMARLVEAVRTTDAGGHHVVWGGRRTPGDASTSGPASPSGSCRSTTRRRGWRRGASGPAWRSRCRVRCSAEDSPTRPTASVSRTAARTAEPEATAASGVLGEVAVGLRGGVEVTADRVSLGLGEVGGQGVEPVEERAQLPSHLGGRGLGRHEADASAVGGVALAQEVAGGLEAVDDVGDGGRRQAEASAQLARPETAVGGGHVAHRRQVGRVHAHPPGQRA